MTPPDPHLASVLSPPALSLEVSPCHHNGRLAKGDSPFYKLTQVTHTTHTLPYHLRVTHKATDGHTHPPTHSPTHINPPPPPAVFSVLTTAARHSRSSITHPRASFRSSSRSGSRAGSRSGSLAPTTVEDGGHVRHTRHEYRTPDNSTHVVTEKYEYDTGDTSKVSAPDNRSGTVLCPHPRFTPLPHQSSTSLSTTPTTINSSHYSPLPHSRLSFHLPPLPHSSIFSSLLPSIPSPPSPYHLTLALDYSSLSLHHLKCNLSRRFSTPITPHALPYHLLSPSSSPHCTSSPHHASHSYIRFPTLQYPS